MTAPIWGNVPPAARILPHWVLWKVEDREKKPTKVPYTVHGARASSTASHTWAAFDEVKKAFDNGGYAGIGFVFTPQAGIVGIDLDHCRDPSTGRIDDWAVDITRRLNSYTEVSPSGAGLHVLVRGKLPEDGKGQKKGLNGPGYRKGAAIEVYATGRYFTVTGDRVEDLPADIEGRQAELDALFVELFRSEPVPGPAGEGPVHTHTAPGRSYLTDEQVVDLASRSKNGDEFKALFSGSTAGYGGDDSAADMALMNMLAFWTGGDPRMMERLFSASGLGKRDKWLKRPDYRERTIQKAISDTAEVYQPPNAAADELKEIFGGGDPNSLPERLKANPRLITDESVLSQLAAMKKNNPVDYSLAVKSLYAAGIRRSSIEAVIAKHEKKIEHEELIGPGSDVVEKAQAIAEKGDPLKYLIWQAQRNHLGDIDYQKVLLLSIASAASETSHGIQPGGNGDKGSGKSDACEAVYHLIPKDRKLDGSLSSMSLFYLQDTGQLKPGMVLFSDDVEYGPIIPIYKRSTGKFQRPSNHYTVSSGKDRKSLKLTMPERVVWWLTSVESVADEQAFDRQYPISTDSRPEHKVRVAREISDRRARKEKLLVEDEGVKVARAIIADMFENAPFKVVIPQAAKAKWLKTSDFRGQEQFWDLVDALVIIRWRQHRMDDDGWLVADDSDLVEAKALMMAHKVAHFADLTEAEVRVVGALMSGLPMTQQELTEQLGIAQCTLSLRLKSIMAKSAIITEDIDRGKKIYRLNPHMDINASYWAGVDLIDLGLDREEGYCSQPIALLQPYCSVIGVPIAMLINNSNRVPSSLLQYYENTKGGRGVSCQECGYREKCPVINLFKTPPPSPPVQTAKNYNNDKKEQQAASKDCNNRGNNLNNGTNNAISRHSKAQIRQTGDRFGDGVTANTVTPFTPEASHENIQNTVNPSPNKATHSDDGLRQPVTDIGKPTQDTARQEHFTAKAAAVTVKPRPVEESSSGPREGPGQEAPPGPEVKEQPVEKGGPAVKPDSSAAGLAGFKAAMARRKCSACEKTFPHDLALWKAKNGIFSYICPECRLKIEGDRNCGSCPVTLVGDRAAIKCNPCIYLGAPA